jgi:hypothetical protein
MVTLPPPTLHAFQPLDMTYFKPFKNAFIRVKDFVLAINNYFELDKIILVGWVDKALEKFLKI